MAPEVILEQKVDYMLDFWSLGIIAFEFLTGILPFNDDTPEKVLMNVLKKKIPWPTEIGTGDDSIRPEALNLLQ